MKTRRRDRHQPGRSHLPRIDHGARLGTTRSGGHRGRDHECANGAVVTVSCAEGDTGRVYDGAVGFHVDRRRGSATSPGHEQRSCSTSAIPTLPSRPRFCRRTIRLARMEFIVSYVKVHPLALLAPERVTNSEASWTIARLTQGYADGSDFSSNGSPKESARLPRRSGPSLSWCDVGFQDQTKIAGLVGGQSSNL